MVENFHEIQFSSAFKFSHFSQYLTTPLTVHTHSTCARLCVLLMMGDCASFSVEVMARDYDAYKDTWTAQSVIAVKRGVLAGVNLA